MNRRPSPRRRPCGRCRDRGWVWLHATDPAGVLRIAEATCPACAPARATS
jgi:hypothetical protein